MQIASIRVRFGAAALAVAAALSLGACDGDPLGPGDIAGVWGNTRPEGSVQVHEHLQLMDGGSFVWTVETFGPGGRPEDGKLESIATGGHWELRGDRLALRATYGLRWTQQHGSSQLDMVPAWDTRRRVRMQGDDLSITYIPTMEQSISQYTLVFQRLPVLVQTTAAAR
jgi:hypothetical protein